MGHIISKKLIYVLCLLFLFGCATTAAVQRGSISHKKLQDGIFNADYQKGLVKAVVEVEI